jgi:hypothetical protein
MAKFEAKSQLLIALDSAKLLKLLDVQNDVLLAKFQLLIALEAA